MPSFQFTLKSLNRFFCAASRTGLESLYHNRHTINFSARSTGTMGSLAEMQTSQPFSVLIAGGAYAGLSAALNLQDLCRGLPPRCGEQPAEGEHTSTPLLDVDITIVDERDGFCRSSYLVPPFSFALSSAALPNDSFQTILLDRPSLFHPRSTLRSSGLNMMTSPGYGRPTFAFSMVL